MDASDRLIRLIEEMEAQLDGSLPLDVEALTLACQDLVAWASRFDPEVAGVAALTPTDEDRALVALALAAIRRGQHRLSAAQEAVQGRIAGAQRGRRALNGYGFLKRAGSERQYVDFKA